MREYREKSAKWAFENMNIIFSLYRYALDFGLDLYGKFMENILFWRLQRRKGREKNNKSLPTKNRKYFSLSKDFLRHRWHFPPFYSWPLLTRSRRKKDGIYTSDMYWAWGNLPAKKAKFYFPFLSPRCLSGSKAVLFCSFSPFLLRKKIFKRSRPPFMGCKGDRIEPKIMFGDKKRFSYKNRTSFREKKFMPAFFSLHPLHHARRFHTLLCGIEHHWALDAMILQLISPPSSFPCLISFLLVGKKTRKGDAIWDSRRRIRQCKSWKILPENTVSSLYTYNSWFKFIISQANCSQSCVKDIFLFSSSYVHTTNPKKMI